MTSTVPTAVHEEQQTAAASTPLTMFGPDFPFAYDDFLAHPAGLGSVPATELGTEVAVIGGGLSGIVAAYELMKTGLKPVVYEADQIGGRLRTASFEGSGDGLTAEMGAMRFPPSSTAFQHYVELADLETVPFPNPLAPATPSTVVDLKGGRTTPVRSTTCRPSTTRSWTRGTRAWRTAHPSPRCSAPCANATCRASVRSGPAWWRSSTTRPSTDSSATPRPSPSFRHREIFGQVGFGTGGWDTDFPNSILEILRVVYTGADDDHRSIVGGSQQLPLRLWEHAAGQARALAARHLARLAAPAAHAPSRRRPACTGPPATASRVTDADGDDPHVPRGGLHRPVLDAAEPDRLR